MEYHHKEPSTIPHHTLHSILAPTKTMFLYFVFAFAALTSLASAGFGVSTSAFTSNGKSTEQTQG